MTTDKITVITPKGKFWEYFCQQCKQLRFWPKEEKPVECGNCGSHMITIAGPGTIGEQQHEPCETCPFTSKVKPGYLGGSPTEVYVGQYFLPYQIPCHELVDYEPEDWKPGALEVPQCVGFAMCRDGDVAEAMPKTMFREEHTAESEAFGDIWDFWAYHNDIRRGTAIAVLNPEAIMELCERELARQDGFQLVEGRPIVLSELKQTLLLQAGPLVVSVWQKTCYEYLRNSVEEGEYEDRNSEVVGDC